MVAITPTAASPAPSVRAPALLGVAPGDAGALLGGTGRSKIVWDLLRQGKDPLDNASHVMRQVDGSHEWTQRAVVSQTNFAPAVQKRSSTRTQRWSSLPRASDGSNSLV